MYFDAHCHLIDELSLNLAEKNGISALILNTTCPNEWKQVTELFSDQVMIYPCAGIHPWFLDSLEADWEEKLDKFLKEHPNVMVGEVGLDYLKGNIEKQKEVFDKVLFLAQKHNRHVHIHCVKAWHDMLYFVKKYNTLRFLFHNFSASESVIQTLLKYDVYFSISSDKNINLLPENKVLVETDSPSHDKKPEDVINLIEKMGLNSEKLWENFQNFLKKVE